jgi:hypothetical protein
MLRAPSGSSFLLASAMLVFACREKADPEPLASYGSERLGVYRSTDRHGTPIVYAYLFPRDSDDCPPLADVRAKIDGRSLAVSPGGGRGTCLGASFKAPLVVLTHGTDFHDLSIEDDTLAIRARVADLRTDARLTAQQEGDAIRLRFDHAFRGRVEVATVTWSGTVPGDAVIDGDTIVAAVPRVATTSGRVVVSVDAVIDLEIAACDGIAECEATWFFHDVLDVSLAR